MIGANRTTKWTRIALVIYIHSVRCKHIYSEHTSIGRRNSIDFDSIYFMIECLLQFLDKCLKIYHSGKPEFLPKCKASVYHNLLTVNENQRCMHNV